MSDYDSYFHIDTANQRRTRDAIECSNCKTVSDPRGREIVTHVCEYHHTLGWRVSFEFDCSGPLCKITDSIVVIVVSRPESTYD